MKDPNVTPALSGAPAGASDPPRSALYVQSVEKAMRVLQAYDGASRSLSLSEIAKRTGMDVSSAQRYIATLATLRYLDKDPHTKKFSLSPRVLDFTCRYLSSHELMPRATPVLQHLSQETGEISSITVLDETEIVFIARIIGRNVLPYSNVVVGARLPAYCTSSGRAMLATLDNARVLEILRKSALLPHTVHTLVAIDDIMGSLRRVREQGYALTEDQYYLGDISVGAAVLGPDGQAIGGVSIAVSRARWQPETDPSRYASLVRTAARSLSTPQRS